jgi:hypothetical protein
MLTDRPEFFTFFVNSDTRTAQIYLYTIARRKYQPPPENKSTLWLLPISLQVRSRYGADNVQKLVVYTPERIDHDAVNARGDRGVKG